MGEFKLELKKMCAEEKEFCVNCHSHFLVLRPYITGVVVTKRFLKDLRETRESEAIVDEVLDCSETSFTELHKFEENVDGNLVFRAKKEGKHFVYCVDRNKRLFFCVCSETLRSTSVSWRTSGLSATLCFAREGLACRKRLKKFKMNL
jgi:hypothetical protein